MESAHSHSWTQNGPTTSKSQGCGWTPNTEKRIPRGWKSDTRWNTTRRKLWMASPDFRHREELRRERNRPTSEARRQAIRALPLLTNTTMPRFTRRALLVIMCMSSRQMQALARLGVCPGGKHHWSLPEARLTCMGIALARDPETGKINTTMAENFIRTWWEDATAAWSWFHQLPEVAAALERHKAIFIRTIMRSQAVDLDKALGLSTAPVPCGSPRSGPPRIC